MTSSTCQIMFDILENWAHVIKCYLNTAILHIQKIIHNTTDKIRTNYFAFLAQISSLMVLDVANTNMTRRANSLTWYTCVGFSVWVLSVLEPLVRRLCLGPQTFILNTALNTTSSLLNKTLRFPHMDNEYVDSNLLQRSEWGLTLPCRLSSYKNPRCFCFFQ